MYSRLRLRNALRSTVHCPLSTLNCPLSTVNCPLSTVPGLLAAIRQVESGGNDRAVGDGGRSIGPYQIQIPYWTDGGGDAGRYRLDAWHANRCETIILGYWRRYCPAALAAGDMQTLARVHNGGPKWTKGKRRAATANYWRKVQAVMEAGAEEPGIRNRGPGNAEATR